MVELPSGTLTFLFTDLERHTAIWESQPDAMAEAVVRHERLLTDAVTAHSGQVVKTTGDGLVAVFVNASDAVAAALACQQALAAEDWSVPIRARMGLCTGEAEAVEGDYHALVLNRAARVMSAGHGGQVLLATSTAGVVGGGLPDGAELLDLGEHRLRDLRQPERLWQLCHRDLSREFPPLRTIDALPGNLPIQHTSFVGRDLELAELTALVGEARLVTLTGVGGVGKTRLAVQTAAALAPEFPEGVWVIDLAAVGDPQSVPEAVATELGIVQRPGRTVAESVAAALEGRRRLLLFDNCEHVLDVVADLIESILASSETVKVLVTSREGLGLPGEHLRAVPSLEVTSEAVELFVERAVDLDSGFSAQTQDQALVVEEICRRLDGIPLAIELAASRTVTMTTAEIRDRLDDRFRLLTGSRRGLERHQTLRNAVHWSYTLLSPDEQAVLNRCSVFARGFHLDAAVAVAGGELGEYEVLDLLDALVRKSLLAADRSGATTRYSMLETIRQFAEDQLADQGDSDEARRTHSCYFAAGVAEAMTAALDGPDHAAALGWIEGEIANIRTAFRWAASGDDFDTAASIAADCATLGAVTSELEPSGWCEELLEGARNQDHPKLLRLVLGASLCYLVGRLVDFVAYAEEAERLFGDPRYERHPTGLGPSLLWGGYLFVGQVDKAIELCRTDLDSLDVPQISPQAVLVHSLNVAGRTDEALEATSGLLEAAAQAANPSDAAMAIYAYGSARRETEPVAALDACIKARELARAGHNRMLESMCAISIAHLKSLQGDRDDALKLIDDLLSHYLDTGEIQQMVPVLDLLVSIFGDLGRFEAAATISGYTADHRAISFWPEPSGLTDQVQTGLDNDRYTTLLSAGAAMNATTVARFAAEQIHRTINRQIPSTTAQID